MRLSLAIRRHSLAFLLIVAVLGGWFLRGIPFPQSATSAKGSGYTNVPINGSAEPLSSSLDSSSCADKACPHSDAESANNLYRLTSGLRPGRGEPIPNAADVHALPVEDVSFYNWRGELLSGWLSLTSAGAPLIILTHGTPGNR